jgi:hypothetical protein
MIPVPASIHVFTGLATATAGDEHSPVSWHDIIAGNTVPNSSCKVARQLACPA